MLMILGQWPLRFVGSRGLVNIGPISVSVALSVYLRLWGVGPWVLRPSKKRLFSVQHVTRIVASRQGFSFVIFHLFLG